MSPRPLLLAAFLSLSFFVLNGCSSSSNASSGGSGGTGDSCTDTFNALCEQACACGGSTSCTLSTVTDAGVAGSITFHSLNDCENLYAATCAMPGAVRANFDYGACTTAVESAACVADASGSKGIAYPAVCNPNAPDGSN